MARVLRGKEFFWGTEQYNDEGKQRNMDKAVFRNCR